MSDYSYIPNKTEYNDVISSLSKFDNCKDNNEIAEASRHVLENVIELIYDYRNEYKPKEATMLELIDSKAVTRFINRREIIESMHYVRKLGMNALHDYKIKKSQAELSKNNIEFVLKYVITQIENPDDLDKLILPKYMSEAKTRKIYIDQYLKEAGWDVIEPTESVTLPGGQTIKAGSILPKKACSEIKVEGMKNASGIGFCDYVLYSKDGKPLAIIEAKKTSEDITMGVQQVKEYGRCMKEKYGYVPVLYYTNGYEIHIIDGLYVDRQVMGFHSLEELEYMIQRRNRKPMTNIVVDDNIAGRPYQKQAVTKVCERFNDKYLRSLLVMATGTGKTRVSMSIVKVLLENNWIKNVLFLADRTSLVEQAFKSFNKILPELTYSVLSDPSLASDSNARVVFSTHQTMINYVDAEEKEYTCGRFDLIIIDEAHRSIFNKYGSIFKYFDSLLVGLTATPRSEVDADTYKIFGCESGIPHFEYKLESAVKDHYLVPYKVEKRTTKLLKGGIKYRDLSEDDKEKVESIIIDELDEDSIIPAKELFKKIYNEGTCSKVLDDLMNNGIHINDGQLLGKTIIFAYNHKHAEMIVETFKKNYPNLKDEFCQLIDNKVKGANDLILQFGESKDFRIAVSVDMLDTGIDVPSVLNLVFFKPVRSHIKFVQMIGRGTRLCEGLIDGRDKEFFLIFDYCNNFEFFEEHPDGIENNNGKSLGQRLFDIKLDILVELQKYEHQNNEVCKNYYDMLKPELYGKVRELKDSSSRISVRDKMDYVDKYIDVDQWETIGRLQKNEIQLQLSALINKDVDEDVYALRFDMLMFNIELDILANSKRITVDSQREVREVRRISNYLLNYASGIPSVIAKVDSLQTMVNEDFWMQDISVDKLEDCREDIRDLLMYLPRKVQPVSVDTPDAVEVLDGGDSPLIDIRTYREKVMDYLEKHMDSVAITKIKNLDKINTDDMKELEHILWNELGSEEEYMQNSNTDNLIVFIRSIIGVEQDVINEKFSEFLNQNELNSLQQEYISEIIDYVRENGDIEMKVLLNEEPFGNYDLLDLFGNDVYIIKNIVNTIHESSLVA